jgi:hypothetical protein
LRKRLVFAGSGRDDTTMDVLDEAGLTVLAAVVSFALGRAWPRLKVAIASRRAKRFWRPIVGDAVRVVVGHHELPAWEASGLLSLGEAKAIEALREHFRRLYLGDVTPVFADNLRGEMLNTTMLVLGGPDMNWISRELWERVTTRWSFADPARHNVAIVDDRSESVIVPRRGPAGEMVEDHGLILKVRNPFGPRGGGKSVMVFAGCFGYGTLGAVQFAVTSEFSDHEVVRTHDELECLISVPILNGVGQEPELRFIQGLHGS